MTISTLAKETARSCYLKLSLSNYSNIPFIDQWTELIQLALDQARREALLEAAAYLRKAAECSEEAKCERCDQNRWAASAVERLAKETEL